MNTEQTLKILSLLESKKGKIGEIIKKAGGSTVVPADAGEKFNKSLGAAFAKAIEDAGIDLKLDEAGLKNLLQSIKDELKGDIEEITGEGRVEGIACLFTGCPVVCAIVCGATELIGTVPAATAGAVAASVGDCAALCALSLGVGTGVAAAYL